VKIGIPLGTLDPRVWAEATREADRLGFESVWLPEHLVLPASMEGSPFAGSDHPPLPPTTPVFDAFTYLGFLAGQTQRIHLATHVYNVGLRHPFIAARAVATLDVVSAGRAEFGVGASWLKAEWDALGLDFATRGRRIDESLALCSRLWDEPVVEHHGAFFDFGPVMFEPKPVQRPRPPIHIGGDAPASLRRAATLGDGWIPMNHTLEQIPSAVRRLAELRDEAGIAGTVEVTLGAAVGTPADLERCAESGVDRVIVRPWRSSKESVAALRRFADEVLVPAGAGVPV